MVFTIQPNQHIVTIKTPFGNLIHFKHTKGTKTFDDVLHVLFNNINMYDNLSLYNSTLKMNDFYYYEKDSLNEQDKKKLLDDCTNAELISDLVQFYDNKQTDIMCIESCCVNQNGTKKHCKLKIFIKTTSGRIHTMPFDCVNSIDSVKGHIYFASGLYPNQQRLIFNGKQLEDDRMLQDYNIKENSTLVVTGRLRGGMFSESSGKNGAYKELSKNTFYDMDSEKFIEFDDI